jgi:hypothetical protein
MLVRIRWASMCKISRCLCIGQIGHDVLRDLQLRVPVTSSWSYVVTHLDVREIGESKRATVSAFMIWRIRGLNLETA